MRIPTLVISFLCIMLGSSGAEAHASLDHADPKAGSIASTAPREVSLWFTESLEPAFSTVEVRDASGARVDTGKAQISAAVMRVDLKPLQPGTYKVHWRAVSADTHTTEGSFSFQVGQ